MNPKYNGEPVFGSGRGQIMDISGLRSGRLTVLGIYRRNKSEDWTWFCVCDCGNISEVIGSRLRSGTTKSCGCLVKGNNTFHKVTYDPIYKLEFNCWKSMKKRCSVTSKKKHHCYAGKGITVCKKWEESFFSFLEDMGKRPSISHSLDRIDGTKGYFKENCRWATKSEQSRNTTRNLFIEYKGERKLMIDFAKEFNIHPVTLNYRVFRYNWPIEKALNTPSLRKNKS